MKLEPGDPDRYNSIAYPMEVSAPSFAPLPVKQEKDQMLNVARISAQREYDRIMELVRVLEKQAADIRRKLEITDLVHAAEYQFKLYHGNCYWLAFDEVRQTNILCHNGPNDWGSSAPDHYKYLAHVQWLGGHDWQELTDKE